MKTKITYTITGGTHDLMFPKSYSVRNNFAKSKKQSKLATGRGQKQTKTSKVRIHSQKGVKEPNKKTGSVKFMKVKAARMFQRWTVFRDCEEYQKGGMFAPCVTCGKLKHATELQGGHYKAGRTKAVLFDEHNCHAQCKQCNCWPEKYEAPANYKAFILKKYGQKEYDRLELLHGQTKKMTYEDLKEIYEKYKQKIIDLGAVPPKI